MMRAYFDSDVLIWHLRGADQARGFFDRFRKQKGYEMWTGAMQRAEVVFFMRDKEKEATLSFLSHFKCAPVDREIVDMAGELYRKWNPGFGIDVNDAILAAAVKTGGGKIYTLNVKHYPMADIIVEKPW
ncbi:MAG: PIN domain-containing protein [Candidatus Aminicenantes bacterium]|nr:PIN domain-containing protein [Candidatus Aminicenantes bacterium]